METPQQLPGRNVLVTGGSQGIGLELARRYLQDGARVLVTGRSASRLAVAARELPGLETVVSDAGRASDRERLVDHVLDVLPDVDVVVNNAGIQRRVALADDHDPWSVREEELHVLLSGPVHLNHLLVPHLVRRGTPAQVVNVTSGGAFVPQPFAPLYSALKAALHSYTLTLRHALAGTAVRVTELAPPAVATGLSGLDAPHGAPVEVFADAAYAGLTAAREFVGHGATAAPELLARVRAEQDMFDALASRFAVSTYLDTSGQDRG
ncbi:MAG: SDR family NAD(P)-dependent oxidoreductase [Aeromicrobium erythreum]